MVTSRFFWNSMGSPSAGCVMDRVPRGPRAAATADLPVADLVSMKGLHSFERHAENRTSYGVELALRTGHMDRPVRVRQARAGRERRRGRGRLDFIEGAERLRAWRRRP